MSLDIGMLQNRKNSAYADLLSLQQDMQVLNEKKRRLEEAKVKLSIKIEEFHNHKNAFSRLNIDAGYWKGETENKFRDKYDGQLLPELGKYIQRVNIIKDEINSYIYSINNSISGKESSISYTKSRLSNLDHAISDVKRKEAEKI